MRLDHITIVAADCSALRRFFVEVAGLTEGARPPLGSAGHWLYLGGQALLHLIERGDPATGGDGTSSINSGALWLPRIDHLALRIDDGPQWQALLQRLQARQLPYHVTTIEALQERQLFVRPAPGVTVEFVIAAHHLV